MGLDDTIKKLAFEVLVKAALAELILVVPFLGLPIINPIVLWFVGKLSDKLFDAIIKFGEFKDLDFAKESEVKAYNEAKVTLKAVQEKPGVTEEELASAKKNFKDDLQHLIRFGH